MKKLKDILYDFNDIVVALLIVAIAAGTIFWRVGDIMAYPAYIAQKQAGEEIGDMSGIDLEPNEDVLPNLNEDPEEIDSEVGTEPPGEPGEQGEQPPANEGAPSETTPPGGAGEQPGSDEFVTKEDTNFTVPAGVSAAKVAELLVSKGLVKSEKDFLDAVMRANKETKLMAGTFKIPAGSNVNDIVKILTR